MAIPREGFKSPNFILQANDGKNVSLKDFKGKFVVLYFYPKDDTPGCTVEACGFRDVHKEFEKLNTVVMGVSPDNIVKHNNFIDKYELPFPLLSDELKKACQDYGVWVEKSMYGRKYMGVARTTFVIGKDGKVLKVFEKVKPQGHEQEILEVLKNLT